MRRPDMLDRKLGLRRRGLSAQRTPRSEPTLTEIVEAIGALIAIALALALTAQVALHFTPN